MKAYARVEEILNVEYVLNGPSILDVKFANVVHGSMTGDPLF